MPPRAEIDSSSSFAIEIGGLFSSLASLSDTAQERSPRPSLFGTSSSSSGWGYPFSFRASLTAARASSSNLLNSNRIPACFSRLINPVEWGFLLSSRSTASPLAKQAHIVEEAFYREPEWLRNLGP